MWVIQFAIDNPVKITVAVLLLAIFGTISIQDMPVQLTPTLDKPEISISTEYPGAAPAEVEEQITIPIEEKLQAVEGLTRLSSTSREGRSTVELEFDWGVNKDTALIDIIKRLSRVRQLPEEAEEPIIIAGATSERRPVYWANLRGAMPVDRMRLFADDYIAPAFERIEGVAEVRVHGGERREIHVVVDFEALAERQVSVHDLFESLARENVNLRGGGIDIGKRRYLVRTVGLFQNPEEIASVIIRKTSAAGPVYLRDVAKVYDTFRKRDAMVRIMGRPAIAFGIIKKSDANTIAVIEEVKKTMARLNRELAAQSLTVNESYDSSRYIWESIWFVVSNFSYGALFAVLALILFLRSLKSAAIIGVSIPIVAATGFMLLDLFGRSLNIVSLAGMAFAVGMVVDNAIVVLENIYRHLQMGKESRTAASEGAAEVWGAILASTLTTLAVFIPILFVKEEAGQLFGDIAIAISFSVLVSLIVAITVIPPLAARYLSVGTTLETLHAGFWRMVAAVGAGIAGFLIGIVEGLKTKSLARKGAVVAVIMLAALASLALAPKREYLPKGNRNLVMVVFKPYVGANLITARKYSDAVAEKILKLEEVKYMFHVISPRFSGIGVRATDEYRLKIDEVERKINEVVKGAPGFEFIRAFQRALFSRITGADIEIDVLGPDLNQIAGYTEKINQALFKIPGVAFSRTNQEIGAPEFRVIIDRERAAALKLSVADIAEVVETVVAGRTVSLYKEGGEEIDIVVKGADDRLTGSAAIGSVTLYTPAGGKVRLDAVARIEENVGPSQINHIEMERAATLAITKKGGFPMQQVVEEIEEEILDPLRKEIPPGYFFNLSGQARNLERVTNQLSGSMALAVVIVYLVMAALFESFLAPLIIMVSVPLAASGAILAVVASGAPLDVLTMLGFVILIGIVVNNAILLVHQWRNFTRFHGYDERTAMIEAVRTRIRPIFMSAATTIFGMAPLVFRGGAGAELYSGLAAAICGGLLVSTIFTLILTPVLALMVTDFRERIAKGKEAPL